MPSDISGSGPPTAHTLVDLVQRQAERYGDKVAFSFSYNGDDEDRIQLTYRDLDTRARAIAAGLQHHGAEGQPVLVFCRPGLDHIAGFFGCLYAGAIAVPVHEKLAPRLSSVIPDARAGFALAASAMPEKVKTAVDTLMGLIGEQPLRWFSTDQPSGAAADWVPPDLDPHAPALTQYTSGSTRTPNGAVVTHRNLLHNLSAIHEAWPGDDREVGVFWLPQHHDMGLIGAVLLMVYVGCTTVLMSPSAFIRRPMRWLEAISRNRGTYTTAPNFAYQMCVERSTPEERAALDLSHWTTAMNGAEPVQAATLRAFAEAFAPAGFRSEAFMPVYGLAEATLLVSGGSDSPPPVVRHVDRAALGQDRVVDTEPEQSGAIELVACGRPRGGQEIVIVDPESRVRCGTDEVGEIWIAGPSVAREYWDKPLETQQTFAMHLADTGEGPFLRTGDLGFLYDGEVFITGRCKDLVVIDGHHHYPHDIEATVQACHPALVSDRGAVFAVTAESGGTEQLVIAQETSLARIGETELREIAAAIQAEVTEHHGVQPDSVVLVRALQIPTTSSGKIQRGQCRQQFVDHTLDTVAEWHAAAPSTPTERPEQAALVDIVKRAAARRQRAASQRG